MNPLGVAARAYMQLQESYFYTSVTSILNKIFHRIIYRVSQEEGSVFWEVIVSAIVRKKVCMNVCPILNGFRYLAPQYFEFGAQYFPSLPP
jgi:hypothetical protein